MKKQVAKAMCAALLFVLLAASQLFSEGINTASVVRVRADDVDGKAMSVGSGVYIGDRLILTCGHLFRTADPNRVSVTFPNGETHVGRAIAADMYWDQGLVELNTVPNAEPLVLASENPKPGDPVYFAGYDSGSSVILRKGEVRNYVSPSENGQLDWFSLTGCVSEGSSGGPVLDAQGAVIGCLWGTSNTQQSTSAVMTGRTQRFLLPWNARLKAMQLAQQYCGPNGCSGSYDGVRNVYSPPTTNQPRPVIRESSPQISQSPPLRSVLCDPCGPPINRVPVRVEVDYRKVVELLKADERFMAAVQGAAGPAGPQGPAGPAGPQGAPGDAAQLTTDHVAAMTAAIIQQLKVDPTFVAATKGDAGPQGPAGATTPLKVEFVDESGNVVDTQVVETGGTLRIPPVVMQIQHLDGKVFTQSQPLGKPITLRLVPLTKGA
jgi:hypothetical protein